MSQKQVARKGPRKMIATKAARKAPPGIIKVGRPKHKFKPGAAAQRDIKKLQTGTLATANVIRKLPFQRVVREIASSYCAEQDPPRMQKDALIDLQESLEAFMVELFEMSNLICLHAKRKTVTKQDMDLAYRAMGFIY